MRLHKTRSSTLFLFFLALVGGLWWASEGLAENRAEDIYLQTGEKEWTVVLKLAGSPPYTIASSATDQFVLEVDDTVPGAQFSRHLREWSDSLELVPVKDRDLRLLMGFPKPVRELRSALDAEKQLLTIRFFLKTKEWEKQDPAVPGTCMLEDLRFGLRKTFVRSVMDLTSRPLWRFSSTGKKEVAITLKKAKSGLAARTIRPGKELKKVNLEKKSGDLHLAFQFEIPQTGFRLFWLTAGSRLVLDSYRNPDETFTGKTALPAWFGKPQGDPPKTSVAVSSPSSSPHGAIPEISPPIVQGPLVALTKKKSGTSEKQVKEAVPEMGANRTQSSGPKLTIAIPREQIPMPRPKKSGNRPTGIEGLEPGEREKEPPPFESKEAGLYGAILRARELGHTGEALGLIAEFLTTQPHSDVANQVRFIKANLLLSLLRQGKPGMLGKVVEAYQDVINRAPDSDLALQSYLNMAKVYAESGNHYLGLSCLDLAIRRYQKSRNLGRVFLERGEIYLEKNLSEKAVNDFKTVLNRYPSPELRARALFGIARYLQARGLYKEAGKRLSKIEKIWPGFSLTEPDFLAVKAQNYLYQKEYEKARTCFYQAINLAGQQEPNDLLLVHIGDTYFQGSDVKKAEKFYTAVKKFYPESEGADLAELRLGEIHGDIGKFKEIKKKNPRGSIAEIATLKVADAYYKGGLFEKTMESLRDLVSKPPKDSMVIAARSLFVRAAEGAMDDLFKKGEFSELVSLFQENEALLKGTIRPDEELLVAQSLHKLKDYDGAVSAYREVDPSDLSAERMKTYYLGLADCLSLSGCSQESIRFLENARKRGLPSSVNLPVTRALAERYRKEKRFKDASELYAEMMRDVKKLSVKETAKLCLDMGAVLNAQGKYQEARDVLNRSIAMAGTRKDLKGILLSALRALGEGYLRERRYRDALGSFAQALSRGYEQRQPGFWEVKLGQAEAFLGLGKPTVAEDVLNKVYEGRGPDQRYWDLRYRLAMDYVKGGNINEGEKLLREVSEEGTPALQSDAQIKLGSLSLRKQLEQLSIWPQIGGQEQRHARQ